MARSGVPHQKAISGLKARDVCRREDEFPTVCFTARAHIHTVLEK